jgi:hypothetical protein
MLQSWFLNNALTPGHGGKQNSRAVTARPRIREDIRQNRSIAKSLTSSQTTNFSKSRSSFSSRIQQSQLARNVNPVRSKVVRATENPSILAQSRYSSTKAPTSVQYIGECEPVSQLTSFSQDWSGVPSYTSHESKHSAFDLPPGQPSFTGSSTSSSRGIPPFNLNLSTAAPSTSHGQKKMNQTTGISLDCSRYRSSQSRQVTPMLAFPTQPPFDPTLKRYEAIDSFPEQLPSNSRMKTETNVSVTSSNPRYPTKSAMNLSRKVEGDTTQTGYSQTSSQFLEDIFPDQNDLHDLIDSRLKILLKASFQPAFDDFEDRQLSFYRRISEAEDTHTDRMKEVHLKHKGCMKQIQELGNRADMFDRQVVDATNALTTRCKELHEHASELEAQGSHIKKMHGKVTGMLKSLESSASTLKDLAKASISSVNQAGETMIQTALPLLKQNIVDMITGAINDLGFNFKSIAKASKINSDTDSFTEVNEKSHTTKKGISATARNTETSFKSANAIKESFATEDLKAINTKQSHHFQSPRAVSPAAETKKQALRTRMSETCLSPTYTARSCVTPCRSESRNFTGQCVGEIRTPSKKRTISVGNVRAKRQRSRYGHSRTMYMDNEEDYSFLTNHSVATS